MSRVASAVALDVRTQWRYGIAAVAAVFTAGWTGVLLAVPAEAARTLAAFVLIADTATFGVFFIGALVQFERTEGALSSLVASPLRTWEYMATKVGTLALLSIASAIPITAAAAREELRSLPGALGYALAGVALCALFFLPLSLYLAISRGSFTGFLTVTPLVMVPFLLVPLLSLADVARHPAAYLVPTTAAGELVRVGTTAAGAHPGLLAAVGYLVLVIATLLAAAHRRFVGELGSGAPSRAAAAAGHSPSRPAGIPAPSTADRSAARSRRSALVARTAAFVRLDMRSVNRDAMLVVVLVGPLLLAVALRLGYSPLTGLVLDRFGLDLAPYTPLVLAAAVVVHVPMMLGFTGALLLLDDVDERHLTTLRTTPVTLGRYLALRAGGVVLLSVVYLAVCVPVSGLAPGSGFAPLGLSAVLASAQAALVVLAVAAFASNKVEGFAILKLLGLVMTGAPVAAWFAGGPLGAVLGVLPPTWPAHALWAETSTELLTAGMLGAAVTGAAAVLLASRALRRLRAV